MIILNRKLFSSRKKNDEIKDKSKKDYSTAKSVAGLVGAGVASLSSKRGINKLLDKLKNSRNNSEEAEKIREVLLNEAKKNGVKVDAAEGLGNSVYLKKSKWNQKLGKGVKKLVERFGGKLDDLGPMGKVVENLGKDTVLLDEASGSLRDADVLAHELGHAHHSSKRSKNIIGKASHKLMAVGKYADKASPFVGFASGLNAAKKKSEGEEEGKVSKNISWALPAVSNLNTLTAESAATKHGFDSLKRLGASKGMQKLAKKRLGLALGTYGLGAASSIAKSLGAREAGKLVGKAVYKDKKKKKEED